MLNLFEKLKMIGGYNNKYAISSDGQVIGYVNKKVNYVNQRIDRAGYKTVRFNLNGKSKTIYVHRLVAKAFVPNHMNLKEVNHLNGIKTDNRLFNLHWVDHSTNIKHAHSLKLIPKCCEKRVVDNETGVSYPSIKEAAKQNGIRYTTMKNYLNGNRKNKTSLQLI